MSSRIMEVVEEVKAASVEVQKARAVTDKAEEEVTRLHTLYIEARERLINAERKLKGVIYEETQG